MSSWFAVIRRSGDTLMVRLDNVPQRQVEEIHECIDLTDFERTVLSDHGSWSNFMLLITRVMEATLRLSLRKYSLTFKIQEPQKHSPEERSLSWHVVIHRDEPESLRFDKKLPHPTKETVVIMTDQSSDVWPDKESEPVELSKFDEKVVRGYQYGGSYLLIMGKAARAVFKLAARISAPKTQKNTRQPERKSPVASASLSSAI